MSVIAIDGPAAAGKGTLAKSIAAAMGYAHLDTGLLYRAVAHLALLQNMPLDDADKVAAIAKVLTPQDLSVPALRTPTTGQAASKIAAHAQVREALLQWQRDFAKNSKSGAVLDGRDIGTVVCPEAGVKLFITANPEVRAQRRWQELGKSFPFEEILAGQHARDGRDAGRKTAPLRPAPDAYIIDTSEKSAADVFTLAMAYVIERGLSPAPAGKFVQPLT